MKALFLLLCICGAAAIAHGQNIIMKDGSTVATKGIVRRSGDSIIARMERAAPPAAAGRPAAAAGQIDEVGFPLQKIAKIEFPEPPQLREAVALIGQGKINEGLAQLDPILRYYESFRDAPGSWWGQAAILKASTLLTQGKDQDATSLIDQLSRFATDPQAVVAGRALSAALLSRRGEHPRAIEVFESVMKDATAPEVLAVAAIYKGRSHLALKQYEAAVLAFLQVPVLYPEEKQLLPASALGAAQAFEALEDRHRAKDALNDVMKNFPAAPEAEQAKLELEKISRLEKALEGPK